MQETIYNDFVINITNSVYAILLVTIIGSSCYYLVKKNTDSDRRKKQLRNRTLYISCLVFAFLLARIWVEGFTQLFAVLGLVSAALVITNKETIMNLVGWLIINWRELFTEGDLVQLDKNKGYIKSIGLLYITMDETIEQSGFLKTGRVLKIPNNHVILHPTINFSYDNKPILQKHELQFKSTTDLNKLKEVLQEIIVDLIRETNTNRSQDKTKSSKKYKALDESKYHISVALKPEKELTLEVVVYFYSYIEEYEDTKINFISKLIKSIDKTDQITLVQP